MNSGSQKVHNLYVAYGGQIAEGLNKIADRLPTEKRERFREELWKKVWKNAMKKSWMLHFIRNEKMQREWLYKIVRKEINKYLML